VTQIPAAIGDLAQRAITLNKHQQRRSLIASLQRLQLRTGARILDFGCGTGLFAPALRDAGFDYCGYDPDIASVRYASRRYPSLRFVAGLEDAAASAPYDVILANCCFHHIADEELVSVTLPGIAGMMRRDSVFVLIDVLPLDARASAVRRVFNWFEQGSHKRTAGAFERLLAGRFLIRSHRTMRFFALSAATAANPVYNDVIQLELALP
jgi:2-polyprenyl-3-methyl-5-hydroxy-6-metoxy-1,4-benzoquinol methylase